jgi:hypothetical protein
MKAALARIATRLNDDVGNARLLRLANNAVFALPAAGLVIRITRSHTRHARARRNVMLGVWFAAVDAPTIHLADGLHQPVADGAIRYSCSAHPFLGASAAAAEDTTVASGPGVRSRTRSRRIT